MQTTLELCKQLIERRSVTPEDAGCQEMITSLLTPKGFVAEQMNFGEVVNLWIRKGSEQPLFVFLGHTDVVPAGPEELWSTPPFTATEKDGFLHGRGVADMKGGIAAFVTACKRFVDKYPSHRGSIALLLTSDEEGVAVDGTVKVVEALTKRGERIDYCIVGEPSSEKQLGDMLKNGRRGSISGSLRVFGKQGHVAYPHLALNPIHKAAQALSSLCSIEWDKGNEFFPPTTFQVSNIHSGTGADNVIPAYADVIFNWRFSSELTAEEIKARCIENLDSQQLKYELTWRHSGDPFLTKPGDLVNKVCASVKKITGLEPTLSTAGGTSDGRFVAPTGARVIEVGLVNETIHKVDERIRIHDLEKLSEIYEEILISCLT